MMQKMDGTYKPSSITGSATVCDDLHSKRPAIKALATRAPTCPRTAPSRRTSYGIISSSFRRCAAATQLVWEWAVTVVLSK